MKTKFSHLEINVSNYRNSIQFYDLILLPLGWDRIVCTFDCTAYTDGQMKIILSPVSDQHKGAGFHRKRIGLNHIALYADSKDSVNKFYQDVLVKNSIPSLYQNGPDGDEDYYAVLFEDPDRMKIEIVYAPHYCDKSCWPNTLSNDFDPYK